VLQSRVPFLVALKRSLTQSGVRSTHIPSRVAFWKRNNAPLAATVALTRPRLYVPSSPLDRLRLQQRKPQLEQDPPSGDRPRTGSSSARQTGDRLRECKSSDPSDLDSLRFAFIFHIISPRIDAWGGRDWSTDSAVIRTLSNTRSPRRLKTHRPPSIIETFRKLSLACARVPHATALSLIKSNVSCSVSNLQKQIGKENYAEKRRISSQFRPLDIGSLPRSEGRSGSAITSALD
jgi:hypothetical protein